MYLFQLKIFLMVKCQLSLLYFDSTIVTEDGKVLKQPEHNPKVSSVPGTVTVVLKGEQVERIVPDLLM